MTSNEVATAQASWATSAWASSYDVTFVNGGTQESRTVTGLTGTTFTARTLVKGATYVFTITARNEVGAAAGEPRSVVVKDDSPAPLPKPTVQVTPLVGGKADMSWTVASDARLTGWLLTILNSDGSAFSENAYPAAQRAQQVIGLTEGSTYTATITARYGTALMSSDAAPFTEPLTPDTAPNPPTITKAEQTLPGEVVVIWAPSPVGGAAKTFNVTVTDTETGKVFYTKTGLTFTTLFVTGEFRNGVAYTFAVTAVNGKGESGPATRDVTVIVTPPAPAIKTVVNNPDQPGMVDITFDSRGTPSVYGVTGWNVQHQVDGAPTWTDTVFPFPIVGVLSIGDLATGKKHNFRMKAIGSKESALSNTVSITVVDGFPAALKFLQADFKGTTEAWLYWGQNATLGKVEGYELVVTDKTTGDEHGSKAYPANQSDTIYTGKFTSGHVYTFAMRQTNRFGDGPASTLDKAFGTAPAPVVTSIQAIQGMSGAADIDFAYPASTMTDWGYTKFAVEWSLDGQDQWTRVILDSYTRRYQARGLQGGKEYKFHLMAMDGTGASKSDWSALSTVTTYGTAPAITESSTPAKGTLDFTMTGDYGADEVIVSVADKGGDQLSYHAKRIGDHGWEINGGRWRAGDCIVSASPVIGGGTKDWSDPITITLK